MVRWDQLPSFCHTLPGWLCSDTKCVTPESSSELHYETALKQLCVSVETLSHMEGLVFTTILLPGRLPEPSGIVYHRQRESFYVVGDQGHVLELGVDGVERATVQHSGHGYEGITCTTDGTRLYAAIERRGHRPDRLVELTPELELTGREVQLKWPQQFKPRGKDGIEGIAFFVQDTGANTLVFWICQQTKPAVLHQLTVDWAQASGESVEGEIVASYQLRKRRRGATVVPAKKRRRRKIVTDLSGLHVEYDEQQGRGELFVLSDQKNRCFRIGIEGKSLAAHAKAYRLPKSVGNRLFAQEGITLTATQVVVVNDEGGVYRMARDVVFA